MVRQATMAACNGCGFDAARVKRGLCRKCYNRVVLRTTVGRRPGPTPTCKGLDPEPCPHPPGSEGRLRTYERRADAGLAIFSPEDERSFLPG